MSINKVTLLGNVGSDPEYKQTNGTEICYFSLATSEKFIDKQGQQQQKTEWHKVVFFNRLAGVCHKYVKKGMKIYVEGKIQTNEYQSGNSLEKKKAFQIIGKELQLLGGNSSGREGNQAQNEQNREENYNPMHDDSIPF